MEYTCLLEVLRIIYLHLIKEVVYGIEKNVYNGCSIIHNLYNLKYNIDNYINVFVRYFYEINKRREIRWKQ